MLVFIRDKFIAFPQLEKWVPVNLNGIEYDYKVSNYGRVKNRRGKLLKPFIRGKRKGTYYCVDLCRDGKKRRIDLHRIVALTMIENPERKPEVNHIDCNPFNPAEYNLEWCTRSENELHKSFMLAF